MDRRQTLGLLCLVLTIAGSAAQTIVVTGCNAASPPGPVQNMVITPNKQATAIRVSWKPPINTPCVSYYEVKVVENGASPRSLPSPTQAQTYSVKIEGTKPGAEYTVTITGYNTKGAGTPVSQIIKLTVPEKCPGNKPKPVTDLSAEPIDHKTLDISWRPADGCYDGAKVDVYEQYSNKQVYRGSVADTYVRVPGLSAYTRYKVVVTAFGKNTNDLSTPTTIYSGTPCNSVDAPAPPATLGAKNIQPPGTIQLDIGNSGNNGCVANWEVVTRWQGGSVTNMVKPPQGPAISQATFKFGGKSGTTYSFAVTPVGVTGKRGITTNLGPVAADGKTQMEASPRTAP